MEELTFEPKPSTIFGIPIEKVYHYNNTIEYLYARNNFNPTLPKNQIFSQSYFNEILSFVNAVEGHRSTIVSSLEILRNLYKII